MLSQISWKSFSVCCLYILGSRFNDFPEAGRPWMFSASGSHFVLGFARKSEKFVSMRDQSLAVDLLCGKLRGISCGRLCSKTSPPPKLFAVPALAWFTCQYIPQLEYLTISRHSFCNKAYATNILQVWRLFVGASLSILARMRV